MVNNVFFQVFMDSIVFDIPNLMYWHLFPFHSSGPRWRICRSLVRQLKSWVTWPWLDFRNNQERAAGCYTHPLASLHSNRSSSYKSRSPSDAHQSNTLRRMRKWRIFRQRSHCPHVDQMNIRSTLAQCRVEIKMYFIGQKEVRSTLPILTPARSIAKWMINRFVLRFDKWVTDDTHRNQNLLQCTCS